MSTFPIVDDDIKYIKIVKKIIRLGEIRNR